MYLREIQRKFDRFERLLARRREREKARKVLVDKIVRTVVARLRKRRVSEDRIREMASRAIAEEFNPQRRHMRKNRS